MTSPLVFKAFNLIQDLNAKSYAYLVSWDPSTRSLKLTDKRFRNLLPWNIANIGVVFLIHFCVSVGMLALRKNIQEKEVSSNKEAFQYGALVMMACHSTASNGINLIFYRYCHEFVPFYNQLLKFEAKLRKRFVTNKEIKKASMWRDLNPKRLSNGESDSLGLVMYFIIHTLTIVPAITPISLVLEDVDPFGYFLKTVIFPNYGSFSKETKFILALARIFILTIAMLEISQTFRTVFNFGLSVFHIYRRCLEVPCVASWQGRKTIETYNQFHILHSGIIGLITPLAAFFLGLNFIILTISTVLCLVSHRILPIQIYLGIPAATTMAYLLLFTTLPFAIHCHEKTRRLIIEWKMETVTVVATKNHSHIMTLSSLSSLYWKRVLKALRPLSFYCGSTGVLTKKTKRIYMAAIIDATVNVLVSRAELG